MGIEQLNNAAWAAGFAMAASEDDYEEGCVIVQAVETQWTPSRTPDRTPDGTTGRTTPVREPEVERVDWVKTLLAAVGRRARVSPA
jgi:hypothetical protein